MINRNVETGSLHDSVISAMVSMLNNVSYDIYTNPGQEHNVTINGLYPDIVMTKKGSLEAQFVLEVETEDTVTKQEAQFQWKEYFEKIQSTFYLVVPTSTEARAKQYCQELGINARFATYKHENNGEILIDIK